MNKKNLICWNDLTEAQKSDFLWQIGYGRKTSWRIKGLFSRIKGILKVK